jgi:uncharacterized protein YecE (DUF72 family)
MGKDLAQVTAVIPFQAIVAKHQVPVLSFHFLKLSHRQFVSVYVPKSTPFHILGSQSIDTNYSHIFTQLCSPYFCTMNQPLVYVGLTLWGRKEWKRTLYPKETKEPLFLNEYAKHFNSIELAATRYQFYDETAIKKWTSKVVGKDFKFCPSMYQGITHQGPLAGKEFLLDQFLKNMLVFGKHLGPIRVQFSDKFSPLRKDELFQFLEKIPKDLFKTFVEVRHPDWFSKYDIRDQLFKKLNICDIGAVIMDKPERRDAVHMYLTVPATYIRFYGTNMQTDRPRIDEWAKRIKHWLENGLKELYLFVKNDDPKLEPELAQYAIQRLNDVCALSLKPVELITEG